MIRRLAADGPAVFLGHCACEALKDHEGVINVFIRCTDEEKRMRRVTGEYGIPASKADAVMRKFDKKRANYYYVNTVRRWDDFSNYDIVLDSGRLGAGCCADMLSLLLA